MCPNIWIYVLGGDSLRILYWPSLKDLSMNGDCNDDSPVNSHESKRSFLRESFFIIFWSQVTNSRRMFWVRQYNMLLFHPNSDNGPILTRPCWHNQCCQSKQADDVRWHSCEKHVSSKQKRLDFNNDLAWT